MRRSKIALVGLAVATVLAVMPATFAAVSDYSWSVDRMTISGDVITTADGTGYATAANTFDDNYTVTATCVFEANHPAEVFCGPQARQSASAPSVFTQDAYTVLIQGPTPYNLILHRLGEGTSKRVLASTPFTVVAGVEYELVLIVDGSTITGCVTGGPCISGTDTVLTSGTAGVGIRHSGSSNPTPRIVDFTYDGEVAPVPSGYDGRFSDDDGNVHEGMIEAIAAIGITEGCSAEFPQYYCPFNEVTRAQMASFLARALELPASTTNWFDDDDGNTHEDNINAIAEPPEITLGCGPPRSYCPADLVTRAQMASFLARAFDLPASTTDWFTDDNGNTHEAAINSLADAGITLGCETNLYCPFDFVARDQMASFLGRALGLDPITP